MLDLDFDAASLTDTESDVLRAYAVAEQELSAARPQRSEGDEAVPQPKTWVTRLKEIEGVPSDQLTVIHGRLIALGLLHFQLPGRDEGVVYRVTSDGRKAISMHKEPVVEESMTRLSA